jgi:acetylornithine deacetylase
VVARLEANSSPVTVLLDAHMDTVPVEGMTVEPFHPLVRDGKVYGRGACDVKGGMAAMLSAFARLAQERPARAAHVVLSCTCDEEATFQGVSRLAQLWTEREPSGRLLWERPTVAVVAEPTELHCVVAHKDATRWKIRTRGRACHSSQPQAGINAINRMARVLVALEECARDLPQTIPPHPLCGSPTLSVGRIEGGESVNTVPDECVIEVDRRVIPKEDGHAVIDQVAAYLSDRLDFEVEMLPPWLVGLPLPDDNNHSWADRLLTHVGHVAGRHRKVGLPCGTNASRIAASGVPAVVFGPGSLQQAHTSDEWISIRQLEQASEVYYQFCACPVPE